MATAKYTNNLTTEEIQQYLNENNRLILSILGRQKLDKGCSREQCADKLETNLNILEGLAETHFQKALEEDSHVKRTHQQPSMMLDQTKTSDPANNGSRAHSSDPNSGHEQESMPSGKEQKPVMIPNSARPKRRKKKLIKFL